MLSGTWCESWCGPANGLELDFSDPCESLTTKNIYGSVLRIWNIPPLRKGWKSGHCWSWQWEGWGGNLNNSCKYLKDNAKSFSVVAEPRGTVCSTGCYLWTWRKTSSLSGWLNTSTGCPGRLQSLPLQRYPKVVWTWSWLAGSMQLCLST